MDGSSKSEYRYCMSLLPECTGCQKPLDDGSCKLTRWERSPSSDEFSDELHFCENCGAWSLLTFVERFAGPDEVKARGPLTEKELEEVRERLQSE